MIFNWQQALGTTEEHLVSFQLDASNILVHQDIANDLNNLCKAARKSDIHISIVSSFRSFEKQLSIWNDKWLGYRQVYSRHGRPLNVEHLSDIEKYKAISLWSAMPGMSRHHWGTDLDVFCKKAIDSGHKVELTPSEFSNSGVCHSLAIWLENNLEKYGFFRPYKNYQQGVAEEPWHISHRKVSNAYMLEFPFEQCMTQLKSSDIKSKDFICNQLSHYKNQYFLNICDSEAKPIQNGVH